METVRLGEAMRGLCAGIRSRPGIPNRPASLLLLLLAACTIPTESSPDLTKVKDMGTAPDLGHPDLGHPDMALPRALQSQDVSILYPLPASWEITRMVGADNLATYGRLVPQALFLQVPKPLDPRPASSTRTTDLDSFYNLHLVSVRLDPCFGSRGEVPDPQCRNQVRLVFQGIGSINGQGFSDDGALQVLYELPREELLIFARDLIALTLREGDYAPAPLGIHPILQRQGYSGDFALGLGALLRAHLGEQRLVRLTFFARNDTFLSSWRFGAFDRTGDTFQRAKLATITGPDESLQLGFPLSDSLSGAVAPETQSQDNLLLLLDGRGAKDAGAEAQQRAFGAALRIENPLRNTPETIDCASCHAAQAARAYAEQSLGLSANGNPDLYSGPGDLRLVPPREASLENLHAFGYLGGRAGLNQRTVNESAAVAARLTELLRAAH